MGATSYKQGVTGSNPVVPTSKIKPFRNGRLFCLNRFKVKKQPFTCKL